MAQDVKVALRKAAAEWAAHLNDPPKDSKDRAFKKLDSKLMKAARALKHNDN
jgi:hypothetical protein